ncbi:MAG TPA: ACT domain-containing protein [Spirochaetia bacterium]|nr:ACT domain-containing protein [Spirochaetales bacterium]HRY79395.1 ACT domain-containing protein [Spirochaetia bacterium]
MRILALEGDYSVYRFDPDRDIPGSLLAGSGFRSVTRTDQELSVVARTGALRGAPREEAGWTLWMVQGPLDFGLLGVLSSITGPLAAAGVSVFAVSTFDTDYILWKKDRAGEAVRALREAGFEVEGSARFL